MKGLLHHVEIYVSDMERSREFWQWLLKEVDYQSYQEWDEGFSLKLGDTYIVFVQTEDRFNEKIYHRCQTGLNHLAFHGGTRNDIDILTTKLRERDVTILYEDRHPFAGGLDYYAVYFEDPDRIKVEFVADEK